MEFYISPQSPATTLHHRNPGALSTDPLPWVMTQSTMTKLEAGQPMEFR